MKELASGLPKSAGQRLPVVIGDRARGLLGHLHPRALSVRTMFIAVVLLPTLGSAVFYGLVASKRYVSEAQFIVRGVNSHKAGGLDALLTSFGISRAADDASAIEAFMGSRDAVRLLDQRTPLRPLYTLDTIDRLSAYPRLWRNDSFESLYDYMQNMIEVIDDPTKGITTLRVIAFNPEDSLHIAKNLVTIAEEMVNRMNARVETDTVRNALHEVTVAEEEIARIQMELTAFRTHQALVDPVAFSAVMLDAISKLNQDLAQTSSQITETVENAPNNPAIPTLRAKARALQQSLAEERTKLAGDTSSIATKVTEYERLTLDRDLAEKRYASALATLENARAEARRQQIYVEEVVQPSLSDESTEPRRLRMVITVAVMSFGLFAMTWILSVGAKDHAQ